MTDAKQKEERERKEKKKNWKREREREGERERETEREREREREKKLAASFFRSAANISGSSLTPGLPLSLSPSSSFSRSQLDDERTKERTNERV